MSGYDKSKALTPITPKQAAQKIGVREKAIYEGMQQGTLPIGFVVRHPENIRDMYTYYIFDEFVDMFKQGRFFCPFAAMAKSPLSLLQGLAELIEKTK